MKKIIKTTLILTLLLVPIYSLAQGNGQGKAKGLVNNVKNKVNTANQGQGDQIRAQTAEHMSTVAQLVHSLLEDPDRMGGIGQQVSEFAKEQNQSQKIIQQGLDDVGEVKGLRRVLFGTDYKALKNIKQELQQNRNRVKKLTALFERAETQEDKNEIRALIESLLSQEAALTEQVNLEENKVSLIGWWAKLFSGN